MAIREEIGEKALELFLEMGYDHTPMSHIAKALGSSKAGLYHYFPNKEDLLYYIIDHLMEENLVPILDAAEEIRDPEERLTYFIRNYNALLCKDQKTRLVIHEARKLSDRHYDKIRSSWSRVYNLVYNALSGMESLGRIKDLNKAFASFAALGMCSWTFYWFDYSRQESADKLSDTYIEIFLKGIKNDH